MRFIIVPGWRDSGRVLAVGYNRRFSPLAGELKTFFERRKSPLVLNYRINAGQIPSDSWIHDPAVGGGRIIGEVCHFVDLCSYILQAVPTQAFAQGVAGGGLEGSGLGPRHRFG